jgi:hypothetical protein
MNRELIKKNLFKNLQAIDSLECSYTKPIEGSIIAIRLKGYFKLRMNIV